MIASAPGQIFLFGEHAVVYSQPALAAAIDLRTRVKSESRDDMRVLVDSEGVGKLEGVVRGKGGQWTIEKKSGDVRELEHVVKAVESTFSHLGDGGGLELEILSDIPVGSGLGSSSAVTTATIAATSAVMGEVLGGEDVSELAFSAEKAVQGPASRTGVSVATQGGFARIQGREMENLEELPPLDIVIGYTGIYGSTAETVRRVKQLRESNSMITNPILETIGAITQAGIQAVKEGDFKKGGALMNANQNLLEGLGVSSEDLDRLITAARGSGALGSKLTGGGGGGSMIALSESDPQGIVEAIKGAGGQPIATEIGVEGLKVE